MIQNASVYDRLQASGARVLVMRQWPRGIRREAIDFWLPDAGPSRDLLIRYRDQLIDWPEFRSLYIQEQATIIQGRLLVYLPGTERITMPYMARPVAILAFLTSHVPQITLLCWERTERCHRFALQDLVLEALVKSEEKDNGKKKSGENPERNEPRSYRTELFSQGDTDPCEVRGGSTTFL